MVKGRSDTDSEGDDDRQVVALRERQRDRHEQGGIETER